VFDIDVRSWSFLFSFTQHQAFTAELACASAIDKKDLSLNVGGEPDWSEVSGTP
jgi:hypothetical protein